MTRWAPDAPARLEQAAIELFASRGYAATTVPEIAERAGLTTRTFFRHYTDKREVLFLRERDFPRIVSELLAAAPPALTPWGLVMHGFETVVSRDFDGWREGMRRRRAIIRSDPHLRERELLKSSMLSRAIEEALVARGAEDAELLARLGSAVFDTALDAWLDDDADPPLLQVLRATRARMLRLVD
ncbi:helix-turn-helix domain-containing protein [Amnibacterium flavum]|nr:TetR/AcrR family transcriptional regulator [Amnibacterium flavum]